MTRICMGEYKMAHIGDKSNKKTILIIGPLAPPVGGMAISLENLLNSDLKNRYDLLVLDITGKRTRTKSSVLVGFFYQIYLIFKLISILIQRKPTIVHVQMASFLYFYRRSLDIVICKLFGKKVIFHLRGGRFVEFYNKSSFLGKFFIKFILNISDRVIALSKFWYDFFVGIMNDERIIIVPNGVFCSNFKTVTNQKKELGFLDYNILVLFIGPIGRRKGTFDMLDAVPIIINKVKNLDFIFCGTGEFAGEIEQFLDSIKKRKLSTYIKYEEKIYGQKLFDYYLSSDIFVLPSYAENLPNSVLEAMAAGLPVVVSDVGAIPEIVKDGVNGFLVKPGDINSIAEKIIKLAEDKDLRKLMGRRNLEIVKEKYDMPIIAEKVDKIYQELL